MGSGTALVQRWVGMFNSADLSAGEAIAADGYVEHAVAPFGTSEPGQVNGPEHLRSAASWLLAQFPDLHMTVEALVEDGDLVAILISSTGTSLGPLNGGMPATRRSFASRQSHWFRVRDGRLAEHWATRDDLGAMLQPGVIHGPDSRG